MFIYPASQQQQQQQQQQRESFIARYRTRQKRAE